MNHIYQEPQFGEDWFTYPNLYSRFVNELQDGSKIVEVGCWKGKSVAYLAVEIINSGKNIKIDAIDTWNGSPSENDHWEDPFVKEDKLYDLFLENISPVSEIVTPIRIESTEAASLYADGSLDVVFIDAGHTYEEVKADIIAWLPKVKKGGYISGHDYGHDSPWTGVMRAVDEIFPEKETSEYCWVYKIGDDDNGKD